MVDDDLFPGFSRRDVQVDGATIHAVIGGSGPPALVLHGFPQTHACWHRVAHKLARHATLVIPDLPGYGDSTGPIPDALHIEYGKRATGRRMLELMTALGHPRFSILGHDRGGRVAYRMALDHPDAVSRMAILDIVPTLEIAEATDYKRALSSWHWSFLAQPPPLPERLIFADPDFVLDTMMRRSRVDTIIDPRAMAQYRRSFSKYSVIQAFCEDYRAGMSVDLDYDRADRDADKKIVCPLTVIWGERGSHTDYVDMLGVWRRWSTDVSGAALPCGHFLQEELPERTAEALVAALKR